MHIIKHVQTCTLGPWHSCYLLSHSPYPFHSSSLHLSSLPPSPLIQVTLAIAQWFNPSKIVGVDIDPKLVRIANKNLFRLARAIPSLLCVSLCSPPHLISLLHPPGIMFLWWLQMDGPSPPRSSPGLLSPSLQSCVAVLLTRRNRFLTMLSLSRYVSIMRERERERE